MPGTVFQRMACALILSAAIARAADEAAPESGSQTPVEADPAGTEAAEDPFPLPEIHVRTKPRKLPATQPVRVANKADFDAWNSKSAADALRYTPGVNVLVGGSTATASPWIRGYRDRDILITFDGIPFGDSLEGAVDLNQVSLQRISRIRVLKTAPSVIFGAGAPGGVIVIETDDTMPQGFFIDGEAAFGSAQRRYAKADLGRGGINGHWAVSAQYDAADNYSLSDTFQGTLNQPAGLRVNSDRRNKSFLFQAALEQSPLGDSRLLYSFSESRFGLPVEAGVPDPDFERVLLAQRNTVGFSNAFRGGPLSVKLYLNDYDYELAIYDDGAYSDPAEIERAKDASYGARAFSTFEWFPANTLVLMASGQSNSFRAEGEGTLETREYAVALENQYESAGRISLAAGLIYTRFEQLEEGRSVDSLDPQASLGWRLSDHVDLHASVARRTRFPKLRELYRNRYGNAYLDRQASINSEMGLTFRHTPGLQSDLSVFNDRIDGLIERPNRRSTYLNLDRVTYRGLEAQSGGWIRPSHFARLSFSLLDAAETLPGGGTRQLRSRPERVWTAEYRHRFSTATQISFTAIHVSGLHDLDPDGDYVELQRYWAGDLRLSHTFGRGFTAYLALSNVADENYQHRWGYPREGRQFMLGLVYSDQSKRAP